jgi:hypothetical protein
MDLPVAVLEELDLVPEVLAVVGHFLLAVVLEAFPDLVD